MKVIVILAPFIIGVLGQVPAYRESKVNLINAGKSENGYLFKSDEVFPDAYIFTQGQIVIKTKNNVMIKTFIVDGMYEKKMQATDNRNFEIKSYECPLADAWMEKLWAELKEQLPAYGHELDEIVVEKIGLCTVWIQTKDQKSWFPVYYILEGESLTKIDEKTAKKKMRGVMVTKELLEEEDKATTGIIMKETMEEVISRLK